MSQMSTVKGRDLKAGDRVKYRTEERSWRIAVVDTVRNSDLTLIDPIDKSKRWHSTEERFVLLPKRIEPPKWEDVKVGDVVEYNVLGQWKLFRVNGYTDVSFELRSFDNVMTSVAQEQWENPLIVRGCGAPPLQDVSIGDHLLCRFPGSDWCPAAVTGIHKEAFPSGKRKIGAWLEERGRGLGTPRKLYVHEDQWDEMVRAIGDDWNALAAALAGEEPKSEIENLKAKLAHAESRRDMFKALLEEARGDRDAALKQLDRERKRAVANQRWQLERTRALERRLCAVGHETSNEKHVDEVRRLLSQNAKIREDYVRDEQHWASQALKWKSELELGAKEWADAALEWSAKVEARNAEIVKLQEQLHAANLHLEKVANEDREFKTPRGSFFVVQPGKIRVQSSAGVARLVGENYSLPLSFEAAVDLIDQLYDAVRSSEANTLGTEPMDDVGKLVREVGGAPEDDHNVITLGGNYGIRCIHCKGRIPPGERACSRKGKAGWRHYPRCR